MLSYMALNLALVHLGRICVNIVIYDLILLVFQVESRGIVL